MSALSISEDAAVHADKGQQLLAIGGVRVEARSAGRTVTALDGLTMGVAPGEVVGVIGESGSGKTTLARTIIGLLDRNVHVTAGTITFDGRVILNSSATSSVDHRREIRGRQVGMIFQSPRESLNPVRRIGAQMREALHVQRPHLSRAAVRTCIRAALAELGLDAERVLASYPHQLSGGMCQRVAIAMAIAPDPQLLIADECTSALDVTTQAEVVGVLRRLVARHQTAMLFVTHNLLLAADLCSRLIVFRQGVAVESGSTDRVLGRPAHPYTQALIAAIPRWNDIVDEAIEQ